jgi:uncharacterized protein (TIGR03435 family)
MATAQSNRAVPPAKPLAFEIVSIRQNVAGGDVMKFGTTPVGFRMVNMTLARVILTAYVPQTGAALYWEPVGFPDWVRKDRYDIEAKVAEGDRTEWQKPASQREMLRAMLQSLLAERCKLVVHRELKDSKVYYLEIGNGGPKFGPKFKEAKPVEPDPAGQLDPYPSGGLVVSEGGEKRFYHAPMTLLASLLTNRNLDGREIQDSTGLTGRYDIVVDWGSWTGGVGAAEDAADPGPTLFSAVAALGLKLEAAKGQTETLVLDHIERPSEN